MVVFWGRLLLFVLLNPVLGWGTRSWDDVSHFLGGSRHGRCSRAMTGGLEMCVLDDVNVKSFTGSGCGSFYRGPLHWIRGWGLPDYLWDLSLGHRTGDGKFEFETIHNLPKTTRFGQVVDGRFGQVVDGFFLGGRGRGRGDSRTPFNVVCFFSGRHEFPNDPFLCYILYIEHVPRIEDSEGADPSRSVTDSTEQWSPQEAVTMFGYIEGSFLVNRTGDACERHVPNIHRVRLYVI